MNYDNEIAKIFLVSCIFAIPFIFFVITGYNISNERQDMCEGHGFDYYNDFDCVGYGCKIPIIECCNKVFDEDEGIKETCKWFEVK